MKTVQAAMPVGSTPGDVTRYLCAAAYLDEDFAQRVVEKVLADEASAVAPSPDVDLEAVVRHCLAAQEYYRGRDLRLTAAFALVGLVAPLWLALAVMFLRITRGMGTQPSLATRGLRQPDSRAGVRAATAAGVVVLLALYFGVVVAALPVTGFPCWLLGVYLAGVPAALACLAAVTFAYMTVVGHDLAVDRLLRTTMTREAYAQRPHPAPSHHAPPNAQWIDDRIAAIAEARDGNVTLYSGYNPWIGYAATSSKWPLTVPLLPAEGHPGMRTRPAEPRPFTAAELVGHVRERLQAVAAHGASDGPTEAVAGASAEATAGAMTNGAAQAAPVSDDPSLLSTLVIEDRVFANGTTVADDERFITGALAPVARLSAEETEQILLRPTGTVRHYLAVHVPLWGGDVVPSVFLHFSTAGQTLHLRIDNHVLGPVHAAYHAVDRMRGPLTDDARRGLWMNALRHTGRALVAAPSRSARRAGFETRHNRRMADELLAMEQDPGYDFGARVSIREMALSPNYHNYFQVVDAERVLTLVQRHTLAAIREFLDAHGYDTADFRAQQQTILNQGVIQQGGMSIVGNQAIGEGATAAQGVPQQPGPAAMAAGGPAA
ncbi:hypothetical protein AB0A77_28980 [Streptomyces varsoviensis]|uniref:hypothetical protein n=1 Tax=Streptomyces varsoviensis TaxID=67373 RepID=UPI0033E1D2C8